MAIDAALDSISAFFSQYPLLKTMSSAIVALAAVFLFILFFEARAGGDLRRYTKRGFVTDLCYALIYQGGIYNTLLYAPIFAGIALIIPQWHPELIGLLPLPIGFLIFWVVSDAIGYWIHRWEHNNAILWSFHSVHHTQTCMTFVTSFRNHLFEQLFINLLMYVPLMLLGMPKWYWAPAMLLQNILEGLQHSDLNWRYGRLYPLFVSPVFHAIHHSPDRARHDSNYGKILSIWDYLFGTMSVGERPEKYGVAGLEMSVSFWGTFFAPFGQLKRYVHDGVRPHAEANRPQ
jgi:sterol desaturase/sphingolipid hydroxylase (fatty acid hydroxylase superfamily)